MILTNTKTAHASMQRKSIQGYKAALLIAPLFFFLLSSCRSVKTTIVDTEKTEDSVRVEYVEKIKYVPVTTYIEVPKEKLEKETTDTTSVLETDFAKSTASIRWKDSIPILFHSIENKPQKVEVKDSVPTLEKEVVKWKYKTVTKTKIVEKEKQLSKFQKVLIFLGKICIALLLLITIIIAVKIIKHKPMF